MIKKFLIIFIVFLLQTPLIAGAENFFQKAGNSVKNKVTTIKKNRELKKNPPPKVLPKGVLAPAVQFNKEDYKDYFKQSSDYKVELQSKANYKISCREDILGLVWGDKENFKIYEEKNDKNEIIDMKSFVLKVRFETYSYLRIYKSTKEIVNLAVSVNPNFEEKIYTLGTCKLEPSRE